MVGEHRSRTTHPAPHWHKARGVPVASRATAWAGASACAAARARMRAERAWRSDDSVVTGKAGGKKPA
jgi:hypothetical protein